MSSRDPVEPPSSHVKTGALDREIARDTIFAVASGAGRAGVAVLRISGPAAGAALRSVTGGSVPKPRYARLSTFRNPADGTQIDRGLCLWFPAPASYTGEDVAELHIHGGRACIGAVSSVLSKLSGLRPAESGEFTRRAFENGKMDLTAAEGLLDLINAETEAQRAQAYLQRQGALAQLYDGWRAALTQMLAHIEAYIDFPDEDLPAEDRTGIEAGLANLRSEIAEHLKSSARGERLREGYRVALFGPPNTGKSTLLNRLARRDAAIVSETAGTTRDVIDVHLDLGGLPIIVTDTAGIRETLDAIEREGVRRSRLTAEQADLRLAVLDATQIAELDGVPADVIAKADIVLVNKVDLVGARTDLPFDAPSARAISAQTGQGIDELLHEIELRAAEALAGAATPAPTRERHRVSLSDCIAALDRALEARVDELRAEDLRVAVRSIGRISGRVDVEDLLDLIFRDFCVGK